jgi:Vam6/Vps39-like protein vacuolar protein sorting-associated protein 39
MPYIEIVKHFFPRHLVIQAKVTNIPYASNPSAASFADGSNSKHQPQALLSDVAFVVAESSEEEAIQPLLQIPIQMLPPKMTGSAWCVLQAALQNMDGPTAQLTCELRYAVQSVDSSGTAVTLGTSAVLARTFVEELQDIEVHASHFS